MSQATELDPRRSLIDAREIHELAMSSYGYIQQAIWWVRLAKALDALAEEILCSSMARLRHELDQGDASLREEFAALDRMADDAIVAIDATRRHVAQVAGEGAHASQVRDSAKWVWKRVHILNCLFEDLSRVEGHARGPIPEGRRLHAVPLQ